MLILERKDVEQYEMDHSAETFTSVKQAVDALFSNFCSIATLHAPELESIPLKPRTDLEVVAATHGYHLYIYNASGFRATLQWSTHNSKDGVAAEVSSYRALCNKISQLKRVVIVIYQAELLSRDLLSILSQLYSYAKRNNFRFKLLLIGDTAEYKDLITVGLRVEQAFQSPVVSNSAERNHGRSLSMNAALIALSFVIAGYLIFNTMLPSNNETLIAQQSDSANVVNIDTGNNRTKPAVNDAVLAKLPPVNRLSKKQVMNGSGGMSHRDDDEKAQTSVYIEQETYADVTVADVVINNIARSSKSTERLVEAPPMMSEEMLAAVKRRDFATINRLFKSGESLNAVNQEGENLLLIAAWLGDEKMLKQAIDLGVPVNQVDQKGRSALFYTSIEGDDWLTGMLLSAGINVNLTSRIKKTALMAAVSNRHYGLTDLLLKHRANIDAQDHSGWSALFYAAWNNDTRMVTSLLQAGANPRLRDNDEYTASDIAELRGYSTLAEQILGF